MPIENFNVRKTTEHTGVRTEKLVLSDLPEYTSTITPPANFKPIFVDNNTGIVYKYAPQP